MTDRNKVILDSFLERIGKFKFGLCDCTTCMEELMQFAQAIREDEWQRIEEQVYEQIKKVKHTTCENYPDKKNSNGC